jgi:L-aspartate oxidase
MEFYQFHPTAFSLPGAPRFLLSEALRGEGAILLNDRGERFMERYHPLLELAPRDVVARAITREGMGAKPGEFRVVHLDLRHIKIDLQQRFPSISAFLARYGLELGRDLIPVRPAAHYLMGGIKTDLTGRSSLPGLYAAGEAACTGVHGANRLASNSLLDGLPIVATDAPEIISPTPNADEQAHLEKVIASLQASMWAYAGLLREDATLRQGLAAQQACAAALDELAGRGKRSRRLCEAQALSRVAHSILASALARTESRGAHFRNDFPQRDDANFQKHSRFTSEGQVAFEAW